MFPLSHIYVSTKATNKTTSLLIIGSFLPDMAWMPLLQDAKNKIHNSPKELSDFINTNYPYLSDLALGVRLHSQVNGGADFYSDDLNVGYAKIEGEKISANVADLLEIPKGDISLVLAHNFIELAVDLHLYQNHKEIWDLYSSATRETKKDLSKIAECLGGYLKLIPELTLNELNNFIKSFDPKNITTKEIATKTVVLPLIKLKFKKDVSEDVALNILNKALKITRPTYQQFLDYATAEVKKNIISKS